MDAEVKQRGTQSERNVDAGTSTEIAAKIGELMQKSGIDDERNPLAAEKIRRDLEYQRQIEQLPQPESAPLPAELAAPEIDRLEQLQRELEAAKAEATRWKKEFGRREGKVGGMEARIKELETQVRQIQPQIDVRQITGREPNEAITAQDAVNLNMALANAWGSQLRQLEERLIAQASTSSEPSLPLDMEAELVEAHPWLTDLPRPQKLRAMQDILSQAGVTVTPQAPASAGQPVRPTATLPEAARRQVAFIEPSNKGSKAERDAVVPERQALNEKKAQLEKLLHGPYKPGQSNQAAELLASLGAGVVDETQEGYLGRRR
jgi:hypothetical protein